MPDYTIVERREVGDKIALTAIVDGEIMEFEADQQIKQQLEKDYNNGQDR